jgi:hypothetical protein
VRDTQNNSGAGDFERQRRRTEQQPPATPEENGFPESPALKARVTSFDMVNTNKRDPIPFWRWTESRLQRLAFARINSWGDVPSLG